MFSALQGILQKHTNTYALDQSQSRSTPVFMQIARAYGMKYPR